MADVRLYHPSELNDNEWRQLQALERDAFTSTLDRSQEEIDNLVEWHDPARFVASHVNPNSEVGKRFYSNQVYTHPRVAVAVEAGELIGFAYSAHNVSGGGSPEGPHNTSTKAELIRLAKRMSVVRNYLWLREVAVRPESQRQGVAKALGRKLLKDTMPLQPVATYVWPEEEAFTQGVLERLGFSTTGQAPVKVFGEDGDSVQQMRMKAPSVRTVLRSLDQ